jgi:hypothetical protein
VTPARHSHHAASVGGNESHCVWHTALFWPGATTPGRPLIGREAPTDPEPPAVTGSMLAAPDLNDPRRSLTVRSIGSNAARALQNAP